MIDENGDDVLFDEDMQTVVDTVHQLDPLPHEALLVLLLCVLCSSCSLLQTIAGPASVVAGSSDAS